MDATLGATRQAIVKHPHAHNQGKACGQPINTQPRQRQQHGANRAQRRVTYKDYNMPNYRLAARQTAGETEIRDYAGRRIAAAHCCGYTPQDPAYRNATPTASVTRANPSAFNRSESPVFTLRTNPGPFSAMAE